MAKLLLLYDTMETDFARDVEAFLRELGLDVVMIPLSPDMGKTLQEKEKHYFAQGVGAVFLLTPGSERNGKPYPSYRLDLFHEIERKLHRLQRNSVTAGTIPLSGASCQTMQSITHQLRAAKKCSV